MVGMFVGLMAGLVIFMGVMTGLTPYFSRKSSQFGVTLPPAYQKKPEISRYQKYFLWLNTAAGILAALPMWFFAGIKDEERMAMLVSLYTVFAILIVFIVSAAGFLTIRSRILAFKKSLPKTAFQTQKEIVVDTHFREKRLVVPNSIFIGIQLLIIVAVVAITVMNYDTIPDRIVTNWDINMQPSRTVPKHLGSVFAIPVMQLFMLAALTVANRSYQKAKQQADSRHPEISFRKNRKFRFASSLMLLIVSVATQLLFALIQTIIIFDNMERINFPLIIIIFVAVCLVLSLFVSFKYGQGGERYRLPGEKTGEADETVAHFDDDANWKFGVFYFNKQDPSLWVEKRFSIGTSLNFANWRSWVLIGLILLLPLLLTGLLMR
ncbi:DUF1648 domain-containing protein [Vagococcus acidifermentans]|uniref:DUF1648 domain-containing protein n=1 Tax=Vagococcus acidifermentans TaxID=564710 RepID=A0A430APS4_9ENTE|nr:DUF5808 domain-containing protein [Vagococcus acidifermentans]RSU09914.1 hypothetical protein CBF27_11480 [Vagococcus acidifermentans]